MSCALSSQLNGKCIELVQVPGQSSFFTVCELPSTVPLKLSTRRNSWSSDGTMRVCLVGGPQRGGLPERLGIDHGGGNCGCTGPGAPRWHSLSGGAGKSLAFSWRLLCPPHRLLVTLRCDSKGLSLKVVKQQYL